MVFGICAKFVLVRKMRVVQIYKLEKAQSEQHQENAAEGWLLEILCSGSQVVLVTPQRSSPHWGFQHFFRGYTVPTKKCSRLLAMGGFFQSPLEAVPWFPARNCGAQMKVWTCVTVVVENWMDLDLFWHLLYHIASEIPGWTWRIKWSNYEAEGKKKPLMWWLW